MLSLSLASFQGRLASLLLMKAGYGIIIESSSSSLSANKCEIEFETRSVRIIVLKASFLLVSSVHSVRDAASRIVIPA